MKRILSILLTVILLLSLCSGFALADTADTQDAAQDAPETYTVRAKAALLIEMDSDLVLLDQNANEKVYPASLTKMMTCLLALEQGKLSDTVTVTASALDGLDPEGSSINLKVGEKLTVEQLCYSIMVASANDSCNVIAEYISGSVASFVELMNRRAAELGCENTHFANPNGLHDDDHYTTAYDLSRIARAALKNDFFARLCDTVNYTIPATNLSDERYLVTSNYLINPASTNRFYYSYASGVKTGYTSRAGRCLVSTASNGKLHLLGVVCGADTSIGEYGEVVQESFPEMADLFRFGFRSFAYTEVLNAIEPIAELPVALSAGAEAVVLSPAHSISVLLPNDYDAEKFIYAITFQNDGELEAPVKAGDLLGSVTVSYQGRVLGTSELVAVSSVPRSDLAYFTRELKQFLRAYWWTLLLFLFVLLVLIYLLRNAARRHRRKDA